MRISFYDNTTGVQLSPWVSAIAVDDEVDAAAEARVSERRIKVPAVPRPPLSPAIAKLLRPPPRPVAGTLVLSPFSHLYSQNTPRIVLPELRYIYSPSDLVEYSKNRLMSYLDHQRVAEPRSEAYQHDEDDESLKLVRRKGIEHELAFLAKLKQESQVIEIPQRGQIDRRITMTAQAMQEGAEIIYQACLQAGSFGGVADFLVRTPNPPGVKTVIDGEERNYHYVPWDTKYNKEAKHTHLLQLCSYVDMLEALQGYRPETIAVVTKNGETETFRTEDFYWRYLEERDGFLALHENIFHEKMPRIQKYAKYGRWQSFVDRHVAKEDPLMQVAGIFNLQIDKLEEAGFKTMTDLAVTTDESASHIADPVFKRLQRQARLQHESRGLEVPKFEVLPPNTDVPRSGLRALPPSSKNDIWFDMEGYPLFGDGGLEYLFGATYRDAAGNRVFKDFWALNREQEKKAFEDFVDWVYARWQEDPNMHIKHYGDYEVAAMRRLAMRHATREDKIDDLLRAEVFVNLLPVVKNGIVVGTDGYSIKDLEPLYRSKREGNVKKATDSLVVFQNYLDDPDGDTWETSEKLKSIRDYNQVDCESTDELDAWLRGLQEANQVSYIPKLSQAEESGETRAKTMSEWRGKVANLRDYVLKIIPNDRRGNPKRWETVENLAYWLEYYWRETKPVFWAKYDRHEMTEEELIEDLDCLGGLTREPALPELAKGGRSYIYKYSFDPGQETKMNRDTDFFFAHDLNVHGTVEEINRDEGWIKIKLSKRMSEAIGGQPPHHVSLIPDEFVSAQVLEEAIFRVVKNFIKDPKSFPKGLINFYRGERPQFTKQPYDEKSLSWDLDDNGALIAEKESMAEAPIVPQGENKIEGMVRASQYLSTSTMTVQGPPGTGKTYGSALAIAQLIADGHRVGIMTNNHKAGMNLLRAVAAVMDKKNQKLKAIKIGDEKKDPLFDRDDVSHRRSAKDTYPLAGDMNLVVGTQWLFAPAEAKGQYHTVFIDEAGQSGSADLLAIAESSENFVPVGDHRQLPKPTQGSHPGKSGESILHFQLGERAIVPSHLGILLDETRRMHPDLTEIVSDSMYDGRLKAHPSTRHQRVHFDSDGSASSIHKEAGLIFDPVVTESYRQGNPEEVERIATLVQELLTREVTERVSDTETVTRPMELNDILIVAPYNLQVRLLQQRLGSEARVGTIDKFQGQEAPVAIISMTDSDADRTTRTKRFLFSQERMNVAISRAKALAIVVGNPALTRTLVSGIDDMRLINFYCKLVRKGRRTSDDATTDLPLSA